MKKTIINGDMKLVPATKPSDNSAIVINRKNYLSGILLLSAGNATSSNTVKVKIQHGSKSDGSDMVDFGVETTKLTATDTSTNLLIDLTGAKQYIRIAAVTEGTAPTYSAQILLADAQYGDEFNV
ncbi:hypothetical protein [Clostridium rectalis]|uniref:hypothetical protein n=1 Tax=Clostridium rectalis TaxID=2040295 RepID=UPI000F63BFB2|nr:hypothetical protein [Clostridium rectalis]